MPLDCQSGALQKWLSTLQTTCSLLGIPCDTYIIPELESCSKWTPLTIAGTAALLICAGLLLLLFAVRQFLRYHHSCWTPLFSRRQHTLSIYLSPGDRHYKAANQGPANNYIVKTFQVALQPAGKHYGCDCNARSGKATQQQPQALPARPAQLVSPAL